MLLCTKSMGSIQAGQNVFKFKNLIFLNICVKTVFHFHFNQKFSFSHFSLMFLFFQRKESWDNPSGVFMQDYNFVFLVFLTIRLQVSYIVTNIFLWKDCIIWRFPENSLIDSHDQRTISICRKGEEPDITWALFLC